MVLWRSTSPVPKSERRTAVRKLLSAALVAAMVVGFAHPAAASTPVTTTGTFGYVPIASTLIRTAGGTSLFYSRYEIPYYGTLPVDLSGPSTNTETDIVHSDGSFLAHGTEVCTSSCTLGGREGGFTAVYEFTGSNWYANGGYPYQGHLTFIEGTGGMAGLHGGGTFGGTITNPGFYAYTYWFAP
jgi:hypothetical protein